MILRKVFIIVVFASILFSCGCGSNPAVPDIDNVIDDVVYQDIPISNGIVGEFTFTRDDGTVETGKMIADENGNLNLVIDRNGTGPEQVFKS